MLTTARSHVNIVKKSINGQAHLTDISVRCTENDTNPCEKKGANQLVTIEICTYEFQLILNNCYVN